MTEAMIVMITASSDIEATRIATSLVDERLAACVNIVPEIRSIFFWEGKTQNAKEALLICKSRKPLIEKLIARVKSLHSYTVPEILALPIAAGSRDYLNWVNESTKD